MVYRKTSISNGKDHSSCIWEANSKETKEKENTNFD
jgi:hypothetical protein